MSAVCSFRSLPNVLFSAKMGFDAEENEASGVPFSKKSKITVLKNASLGQVTSK